MLVSADQVSFLIQKERIILMLSKLYPGKPVKGLSGVAGSKPAGPTVSAYCQGSLQCRQDELEWTALFSGAEASSGPCSWGFWSFHQ